MANKFTSSGFTDYKRFAVPSTVGGVAAWLFSASIGLGIVVFLAVWLGHGISHTFMHKKK